MGAIFCYVGPQLFGVQAVSLSLSIFIVLSHHVPMLINTLNFFLKSLIFGSFDRVSICNAAYLEHMVSFFPQDSKLFLTMALM